jgi:hypothetical protein
MPSRRVNVRDDHGLAMLTAITVLALLTAIGLTVTTLGVNNLQNANRDRQAGAALGASDAGVAQAIEYIRGNGVGGLNCPEAQLALCPDNNATGPSGWTNPSNPKQVPLASGVVGCTAASDCARVWIGTVQQFAPPLVKTGIYRIHSNGVYGNGPGARNVAVDITVTPDAFPIGVFGEQISGNGGTRLYNESLFARSCISPRDTGNGNGTKFSGIDPYWGIPAAAHTTSHISTANACSSSGYIHASSPATKHCPDGTGYNALAVATMKYDQSGDGGAVSSTSACYHSYLKADGTTYYPENDSTLFTTADLQKYGYRPRGLTDSQYSGLKSRAQAQGLYNVSPGSINAAVTTLLAGGTSQPVLYFDNGDVSLSYSNFPSGAFERAPSGTCSPRSVVVVVEHGNLTWQGGNSNWFDGAFFVPDGTWTGNGGYNILGTLWANNVSLGGNEQFQLDSCYVTNAHGAILDIKTKSFREDDAQDIN